MLPLKVRLKILNKLAQAVPGAPPSPESPTAPTEPTSTTAKPTKHPSQPATAMMNVATGWPNWVPQINGLVHKIDVAIIAGTDQKYNFNDLFQNRFPTGVDTEFPPPDPTKDIIGFGRLIYQQIMNNGTPFRESLKHEDMRRRVNLLLRAPQLQKFQQVNVKGPLGGAGVDLTSLRNDLLSLYNSIPAT